MDEHPTGVVVLEILEECLTCAQAARIRDALKRVGEERMASGCTRFVVDLSRVAVLDSMGWAALITFKKAANEAGARIALANAAPSVQRLLEVAKLDRTFDLHPDVESAATHLAN